MICPCIVLGRVLVLCRWAVEKPSSRLKAGRSGPLEMGPELKVDVCIGAVGIEYVCLNLFKPLSGKNLWCARRSSKRPRQKKESAPARARRPRTYSRCAQGDSLFFLFRRRAPAPPYVCQGPRCRRKSFKTLQDSCTLYIEEKKARVDTFRELFIPPGCCCCPWENGCPVAFSRCRVSALCTSYYSNRRYPTVPTVKVGA